MLKFENIEDTDNFPKELSIYELIEYCNDRRYSVTFKEDGPVGALPTIDINSKDGTWTSYLITEKHFKDAVVMWAIIHMLDLDDFYNHWSDDGIYTF